MLEAGDDLRMVRDAAARFVREISATGAGAQRDLDASAWSAAVEQGWAALAVPEADGGLGAGAATLCALADELGRGLMVGRFLVGTVLASQWLVAAPPGTRRERWLHALLGGSRELAIADGGPSSRGLPGDVSIRAHLRAGTWVLTGYVRGAWTDALIRSFLVPAVDAATGEMLLFDVEIGSGGLSCREFATVDGGRAMDLDLEGVAVNASAVLAGLGSGFREARLRGWDVVLLAEAAECVGLMQALIDRTSDHLATRKQFGQPLGKFQVLRHRMADMGLARYRAEALVEFASGRVDSSQPSVRRRLVSAALFKALSGARYVAEQAVQLHGGMGVSEDVPVGRYLRRVLALEATLGSPSFHLGEYEANVDP